MKSTNTMHILACAVGMTMMSTAIQAKTEKKDILMVGIAKADITPPVGAVMWGYSNRPSGATGTRDPLYAKVLVFADGHRKAALVTLDLGRTFAEDQLQRVRESVAKDGVDTVMLVASHTHHGPSVEIHDWPTKDEPWVDRAVNDIIRSIRTAGGRLKPASIRVAYGQVDEAHNRRHITPDGNVLMRWRNAKREPTSPVDKTVTVLRVDDEKGKPLAVLVHYACHPVVLGPDNVQYSADYPGIMMSLVEKKLNTQCMFVQGACGDINPYMDKSRLDQNGVEHMRRMGQALAREVIRQVGQAKPLDGSSGFGLKTRTSSFRFQPRWDLKNPDVRKEILGRYKALIEQRGEAAVLTYFDRFSEPMEVRSTTLLLGDQIAFVGFPGEFFVEFQIDLRKRSPVPNTIFCGYADGYAAYFPTIQAAAEGGYGAGYQTFVEVGAGEKMVDQAVINLHDLLGNLGKVPDRDVEDYPGQLDE